MIERLRFAPSPTGDLHVGGARAALFNWLYARKTGGKFLLRIEDTDTERSSDEALESILDSLRWLGMDWDEELVYQSKRGDLYRAALDRLVGDGAAYPCFCTKEKLDAERERARIEKLDYHYTGTCRGQDPDVTRRRIAAGEDYTIRFRVPAGETVFEDLVHGETRFGNENIGDFIIARADGSPVYLLGVAVDDADMGITLVMRGDDHISNTPRQIMLMEALGHPVPRFAHLPQVLGEDKRKLSKRHGAVSVMEYRRMGFLPRAVVNFLALLGWNPDDDREKMDAGDLIAAFSIEGINKKSGVFDHRKLEWLNGQYLNDMTPEELLPDVARILVKRDLIGPDDVDARHDYLIRYIELMKERCRLITDFPDNAPYFFADPDHYEENGVKKHFKHGAADRLDLIAGRFSAVEPFDESSMEAVVRSAAEELEVGAGKLIHPTRLAVSGVTFGPGLFELLETLGRETVLRRMRRAASFLRECTATDSP